jgi:antitoxin (DNA-binding transcriptional repressor) of toxin-antitoxin stability system
MIANIRKLRSATKEILSAVGRGNTVFIANRGRTCAKIVPVSGAQPQVVSLAGIWKNHKRTASVHAFIDKLRASRHAG